MVKNKILIKNSGHKLYILRIVSKMKYIVHIGVLQTATNQIVRWEILFMQMTKRSPVKKGYQERSRMHVVGEKINSNKDLVEDFLKL